METRECCTFFNKGIHLYDQITSIVHYSQQQVKCLDELSTRTILIIQLTMTSLFVSPTDSTVNQFLYMYPVFYGAIDTGKIGKELTLPAKLHGAGKRLYPSNHKTTHSFFWRNDPPWRRNLSKFLFIHFLLIETCYGGKLHLCERHVTLR